MRVVCFVAVTSLTGCQALVSGDDILTDSCRNDENVDGSGSIVTENSANNIHALCAIAEKEIGASRVPMGV